METERGGHRKRQHSHFWMFIVDFARDVNITFVSRIVCQINSFILCVCMLSHWRRQWQPTPVLLPGKSHGQRSLVGCSPWGRCQSNMTEWLHFHFSLSCIGEGNGNPLHCSCLENPSDGEAWLAGVYRVAQSQTRLKQHSSSVVSDSLQPHGL